MKAMRYRNYLASVEFDAEDEIFVGHVAGIRDVVGFHADTVAALKQAFHEAVDDYLETCARLGKDPQRPFSGNLMLRIDAGTHALVSTAAELEGKSLNQWSEEVLARAANEVISPSH